MVIQIALGIMLGFIFLALVTFGGAIVYYVVYFYTKKRNRGTMKRYDFDDDAETDAWADDADDD